MSELNSLTDLRFEVISTSSADDPVQRYNATRPETKTENNKRVKIRA
jgi:hypothetical protein